MGKALYRTYRSKSLSEVVGQEHITDILTRALKKDKIAHAYLFTGPRGVGKTSVARILAHEINDLPYEEDTQHPDIIEIDAASNRRIDDIRDLREKVQIAPAIAKYKVYIIDEVHMLTGESFNAFLKTLEEPPAHVVFILATTDAHKLPVTITSRTQRFAFRSITPTAATTHLDSIAKSEGIAIDDDALALVVSHGDGSFRDSISLLDQLSSLSDKDTSITTQLVEQVLGMASGERIMALLQAYGVGDQKAVITILTELEQRGIAPAVTASQLIHLARQQLSTTPKLIDLLDGLISVAASPRPDVKLLVTLLAHAHVPRKTVAAATATPTELQPLAKEATKAHPNEERVRLKALITTEEPSDSLSERTSAARVSRGAGALPETRREAALEDTTVKKATNASLAGEQSTQQTSQKSKPTQPRDPNRPIVDFDWDGYMTHLKENHIALATILTKCRAESDGQTLTIYTGTAFWKKKLDSLKYQLILNDALGALGFGSLTIETIPATMPPKDSQAAAVAAIMGGGEEVEL